MSPQKSLCVLCELRDLCGWSRSLSVSMMEIIVTTDRTLLANHSNRNTAHPASPEPEQRRHERGPGGQPALAEAANGRASSGQLMSCDLG